MQKDRIFLLGLPINRINMQDTIDSIEQMISNYRKNSASHYVATLNADFLANAHGWTINDPYHPELMKILRGADLLTADGLSIVWFSRWLGNPLPDKITGLEIFTNLAKHLANQGRSIYLLGGLKNIANMAAEKLQKEFPPLKIVGTSSPFILTKGDRLEESLERDRLIIEAINQTKPDVLFIQLGHPKQEIWFERIRSQLHVPVSVGIGGAFESYLGIVKPAPKWMQDKGLAGLHKFYQEPFSLWARYIADFFKLTFLGLPLFIYHHLNAFMTKILHYSKGKELDQFTDPALLFLSSNATMTIIPLPIILDENSAPELLKLLQDALEQDVIILDFAKTRHLDLAGLGSIFQVVQDAKKYRKVVYFLNIHPDIKLLMYFHGLWECVASDSCENSSEIIKRLRLDEGHLFEAIQQINGQVILSFFGELTTDNDYERLLNQMKPILQGKNCIIDMTYCNGIENRGFTFLLSLLAYQQSNGRKLTVRGTNRKVRRQFKIVKLNRALGL